MTGDELDPLEALVTTYVAAIHTELEQRWNNWPLDLSKRDVYEVIGALLARQVSLARHLAYAPSIWNGHVAPVILRTMIDTYITLAWIFGEPEKRSRLCILHGLGQEKLQVEHLRQAAKAEGKSPDEFLPLKVREEWLRSQRVPDMTEVNVGSWSGLTTAKMAEEAGCRDLYNFSYQPFSAATHSMWHHVARYNLKQCRNPLHRFHHVPADLEAPLDPDYLYRAAKYVAMSFELFDEKAGVKCNASSGLAALEEALSRFPGPDREADPASSDKDYHH